MIILGIETSCDETAAAILQQSDDRIIILSNVVASSAKLQSKYGGIIPEQAAREQIKAIIPVITEAISNSELTINNIDAIAVTQGPGLIGSLLVGVETAKTLSLIWDKPLIPTNHLIGHFYANWVTLNVRGDAEREVSGVDRSEAVTSEDAPEKPKRQDPEHKIPSFPCLGLLVSGGHTDLVLFKAHGKYSYLGGTRDDAAGECFDKCARLLGLPYPGGPALSKLAQKGNPKAFKLPRPMIDSADFDFSFSGLKTAVANLVKAGDSKRGAPSSARILSERSESKERTSDGAASWQDPRKLADLCASIEQAIIDSLVKKTILAAQKYELSSSANKVEQIMVAGGVASNQKLVSDLQLAISNLQLPIKLYVPPPYLCTDNAAMIAAAAFFQKPIKNPLTLQADPNLSLAY